MSYLRLGSLNVLLCLLFIGETSALGQGKRVWKDFIFQDALERDRFHYGDFPDDFGFGTATAAYQIEGAWNVKDKGESIWDNYAHRAPCRYLRNQTGDIACDSYHNIDDDIEMMKELGVTHYRFSISWSRLFPDGKNESGPLPDGVRYYNEVIDKIIDAGVIPMATLYHWDLPQALQDEFGGFNSSNVVEHYLNYADFCFREFGDRVYHWFTFNEPFIFCSNGHGLLVAAPGLFEPAVGVYNCIHNIILSHAEAYHRYHELYPAPESGKGVSITINTEWAEPKDPLDQTHYDATERFLASIFGIIAHPIYVNGDYPELLKTYVYNKTQSQENFQHLGSRLPEFTEEQKARVNQTSDFFSLQQYSTRYIEPFYDFSNFPSYLTDRECRSMCDVRWEQSPASTWLRAVPWGLRRTLNYIKAEYGDRPIWITENGFEDSPVYDDVRRIFYFKSHLNEVLKAIQKDGVDVRGYCAWSLMDNFEWGSGYVPKFGIYYVDFEDEERTRYKKRTADWFQFMIKERGFKQPNHELIYKGSFPSTFAWGAATAAYEIEGGHNDDGKGRSVWDQFANTPGSIVDGTNGNVACDSYNRIDDDIKILKELRVSHYSFSISWPRVLPDGHVTSQNEAGIDYYNRLIDALIEANIQPVATLYHWDLPKALQDEYEGWMNDQIIDDFASYADLCFNRFGDRVKMWMTIGKPQVEAKMGFDTGEFPPGVQGEGKTVYEVAHRMILAHAKAWHVYNDKYKWMQKGKVSISMYSDFGEPFDGFIQRDVDAAIRFNEWSLGWFMNPLVYGEYPAIMKKNIAAKSMNEGLDKSRLPEFTLEQRDMVKGSIDFVAIEHYNAWYVIDSNIQLPPFVGVEECPPIRNETDWEKFVSSQLTGRGAPGFVEEKEDPPATPSFESDMDVVKYHDWTWQESGSLDQKIVPWGIRRILLYVKDNYGDLPVYITGNGYAEPVVTTVIGDCNLPREPESRPRDVGMNDTERVEFLYAYTNEVLKSIELDHVDVRGYFASSLMDGFQWLSGFSQRNGMYRVDRSDQTRSSKKSAWYYADLIRENAFKGANGQCPYTPERERVLYDSFSADFSWSSATSSYQIEGAWDVDGKGESIWDRFTHEGRAYNNDTGDVACDSYNKYKEDVQLLKEISVGFYRFSISWPRVIPSGELLENGSGWNQAGVDYYNNLIDELLANGMQPQVTLYHWDLPQALQDKYDGWLDQDGNLVKAFTDYADFCFRQFGDRVKFWITFNEPFIVSQLGYGYGVFAPAHVQPDQGMYLAAHTVIKAHASAYHHYDDNYRATQNGKIGITLNSNWVEPSETLKPEDIEASQRSLIHFTSWYAEPIFNSGDYSPVMKWNVGNESEYYNYTYNRLPEFTPEEIEFNKGTSDFFGLNHYTSNLVVPCNYHGDEGPNFDSDSNTCGYGCGEWPGSASDWLYQVPWGIRKLLTWIKRNFGDPDIYITENGISEHDYDDEMDEIRINYYRNYINEVLKALKIDGVKVKGYTAWSLMDNFEWAEGYSERFGLHWVNFSDPDRPRIQKDSALFYKSIVEANSFIRSDTEPWEYFWARDESEMNSFINGLFKDDFVWGAYSAAYKTEGAWMKNERGKSIWDTFSQESGKIPVAENLNETYIPTSITDDRSSLYTGNIAADCYYKTELDAQLLHGLGASRYQFSLSWSRIFPGGNLDGNEPANNDAIMHYNYVIDELMSRGITPEVTLYHYDLPQALENSMGWLSSNSVSWFEKYADFCFQTFGDRVKNWVTIYDPFSVAWKGYRTGIHAPGKADNPDADAFIAGKNLLLAHASAWRTYDQSYRSTQNGKVTIALASNWYEPLFPTRPTDVELALFATDLYLGWFAEPIYVTGNYPQRVIDEAGSNLPALSESEQNFIKGASDYFYLVPGSATLVASVSLSDNEDTEWVQGPYWLESKAVSEDQTVPWSWRRLLYLVNGRYVTASASPSVVKLPIFIGDDGLLTGEITQPIDDYKRVDYYKSHMNEVLKAQDFDNVPVGGLYIQFMDGFEWEKGFTRRSGIYHVDFNRIDRPRTPKSSATYLSSLINRNGFPQSEDSKWMWGTFSQGFAWGVSSAAFSIEGGYDAKSNDSVWDDWADKNDISNSAADHYTLWQSDVQLLKDLGVSHYRMSISWTRMLTAEGQQFYTNLFSALNDSGISIIADLYHHDMPLDDQNSYGGWAGDEIVQNFVEYARSCFDLYAPYVGHWITIASPLAEVQNGYMKGIWPPGETDQSKAFAAAHNMLKAHAKVWKMYDEEFRPAHNGRIGFSLLADWAEPSNFGVQADYTARDQWLMDTIGWFAGPLTSGDYPAELRERYGNLLPPFTSAESAELLRAYDFWAIDHYTTYLVNKDTTRFDVSWPPTGDSNIKANAMGLRKVLNWISQHFTQNEPLLIAASGLSDNSRVDVQGSESMVQNKLQYINEALKAQQMDGINIFGYCSRSFLDGLEWDLAYTARYGAYAVNFDVPSRDRTITKFGEEFKKVISNNGFPSEHLLTLLPLETEEVIISTSSSFTMLPASEYPSKASESVWSEFSSLHPREINNFVYGTFPAGFKWSVSTSAYQIEGAWNEDGKGESIWDRFSHTPGKIANNDTGDIACDSYHKVSEDVNLIKTLGVDQYRFSLAWTRIFPDGTNSTINQAGIDYYNSLIDSLLAAGVEPVVTLYHWDLPQALEVDGGFLNDSFLEHFNNYADFCFKTFGDRVKFWITFNEPYVITWLGYGLGVFAPGVNDPGVAPYVAGHNLIRAHAKAYRTYERKYKGVQGGRVGMTISSEWAEPKDPSNPEDVKAADRMIQSIMGWFAHPLFKNGDYPEIVKEQVANKSAIQGFPESRLPVFTEEEKQEIAGSQDFFALNGYTTRIVTYAKKPDFPPFYEFDRDTHEEAVPGAIQAHPEWLQVVPWGMRRLLNWIDREYGHPEIYITENGVGTDYATVDDQTRVLFYKAYINEALKAQMLDGVNLRGYTAWSLMDNFEWNSGYGPRFGLFDVDFEDDVRPRKQKRSSLFYNELIRNNGFPAQERDERIVGNFPENFIWAVATSSYQIEGAWNVDGKGLGIWDQTSHTPGLVQNFDNGDIACDSYNKVDDDVEIIRRLGVTHYRFSLSWPRILPNGRYRGPGDVNMKAIDYYNRLIDGLLQQNIQPMVTLYHWDLPHTLQLEFGGWPGEEIVDLFVDYADVCFQHFGDRVKQWITFNEPWVFSVLGYSYGTHAPNIQDGGRSEYKAGHNLLLAHGKAYHLYDDKYRETQNGQVGITFNSDWTEPRNPYKEADHDARERVMQFFLGWFAHPIFKGDYPEIMKTYIAMRSEAQGEPTSRLPSFTEDEKNMLFGTSDFFGLNHYTTNMAIANFDPESVDDVGYDQDREAGTEQDYTWNQAASVWLKEVPWGIRRLLNFIKEEYNDPPILITENGFSEEGESNELNDWWRKDYYYNYINEVLKAMTLDDVNVIGYTAWSLMDNFEWAEGYTERFGMTWVDFNDPNRPRTSKQSSYCYMDIMMNSFPAEGLSYCVRNSTDSPPLVPTSPPSSTTKPSSQGPTFTSAQPISSTSVILPPQFLGLSLDTAEAETAMNVLFGLTITFFVVLILGGVRVCCMARKSSKTSKDDFLLSSHHDDGATGSNQTANGTEKTIF